MKRSYVACLRALRRVLQALGLLRLLDRWADKSRTWLWVRSWLSIYDLAELIDLDVPWWTFESSDAVAHYLDSHPSSRAFEWGSGASTVWLARRCGSVESVEHDAGWAEQIGTILPENAFVRVVEPAPNPRPEVASAKSGFANLDFSSYVSSIDDTDGDFDLIVIDGRAREACLDRALERLSAGGMIVFDNVDRARYREAIARHGPRLDVSWTKGRTPALPYPTQTALIRVQPHTAPKI